LGGAWVSNVRGFISAIQTIRPSLPMKAMPQRKEVSFIQNPLVIICFKDKSIPSSLPKCFSPHQPIHPLLWSLGNLHPDFFVMDVKRNFRETPGMGEGGGIHSKSRMIEGPFNPPSAQPCPLLFHPNPSFKLDEVPNFILDLAVFHWINSTRGEGEAKDQEDAQKEQRWPKWRLQRGGSLKICSTIPSIPILTFLWPSPTYAEQKTLHRFGIWQHQVFES